MSALETLRELERRLHRPEVRSDACALDQLLHPAFHEFGRSGATFTRHEVLVEFSESPQDYAVWSQDFKSEELQPGVVLLTYRSAHVTESGELERHTLRASLWLLTPEGWRLRFHQGTPTAAFERRVSG